VIAASEMDAWNVAWIGVIVLSAAVASRIVPRLVRRVVRRLLDSQMRRRLASIAPRALVDSQPVPVVRYEQRAEQIGTLFRHLTVLVIWLTAGVLVLRQLHVDLATVVTGAGFLGVAIAFGAQEQLRDALAGFFILVDDRFGVGDDVEVGEITGRVERVTLRWTRIRDLEGTEWYVQNGRMQNLGNRSQHRGRAVVDVDVPASLRVGDAFERITHAVEHLADDERVGAFVTGNPEILGVQDLRGAATRIRVLVPTQTHRQDDVALVTRARIRAELDRPPGGAASGTYG
jgi:small conductance mechanosensitive channel